MKRSPDEYWKHYRGAVGRGRWRMPSTRQQMYGVLMRLGSLWYRLHQAGLFWPPLLTLLKEIEEKLSRQLYALDAALEIARPKTR